MSVAFKVGLCHGLREPRTQKIRALIGAKKFLCGASSLLLLEEYLSYQRAVLKGYSGNGVFHDYIHTH